MRKIIPAVNPAFLQYYEEPGPIWKHHYIVEDFIGNSFHTAANTTAGASSAPAAPELNADGCIRATVTPASDSRCSITFRNNAGIRFFTSPGLVERSFQARLRKAPTANAGNSYSLKAGFFSEFGIDACLYALCFLYDPNGQVPGSLAVPTLQLHARNHTNTYTLDSGIALTNAFQHFYIKVTNPTALFFIDGKLVGSIDALYYPDGSLPVYNTLGVTLQRGVSGGQPETAIIDLIGYYIKSVIE
jgi:hypothetical protein